MTTALTDTPVVEPVVPPVVEAVVPPVEPVTPPVETPPADFEFAFPDGFDAEQVKLDDVKAFAKDLGLDPVADKDKAQKILDKVIALRGEANTAQEEVIAGWADQAKADKEIGGDKFDATLASARTVIENAAFVTPEFKAFLDETGLGNHPEMIRTFARLAPHFTNDTPVPGGGAPLGGDPLQKIYDKSNHN